MKTGVVTTGIREDQRT